jgi:ATP phosphoribosyltransferase regulatory subunit
LIGAAAAAADAEVIVLMARALAAVGLEEVSVDLTVPTLVPVIVGGAGVGNGLRAALDHKDSAGVAELGGSAASLLCALIEAVGPAEQALARLRDLTLPAAAAAEWERLVRVVALVRAALPSLTLTIDPVENRGFEYHTGVAFTVFVRGYAGEVGRGGRYLAHGEPATGATLYTDSLLDVLPGAAPERRAFLPAGAEDEAGARLRALGWITVAGLDEVADAAAEAKRQNCGYLLVDGELVAVSRPPGG